MAPCLGQVNGRVDGFWMFRLLAGLDEIFDKAAIRCDEVAVTLPPC